uniref:Uncharacterized protein n=1 Tax=Siphoviridae sp. ctAxs8 TaxID=2825372 RepID=A0A8S5PMZ1_9CAUD|nr:MAG TPA: hypothetical protein [Siphoviridae sp. ctAxs8]
MPVISETIHIFPKLKKLQGYNNAIFKLKFEKQNAL